MIKGYAGRILEVDLSSRRFFFAPLDEESARLYIARVCYTIAARRGSIRSGPTTR